MTTEFPHPDLAALDVLAGTWDTRITTLATGETTTAVDTYAWRPGKHFLAHDAEVGAGGSLEIIGRGEGGYVTRAYDEEGGVTDYRARLVGRAWEIDGEAQRFRGTLSDDGRTLEGRWERRKAGWEPWMDVTLRKRA